MNKHKIIHTITAVFFCTSTLFLLGIAEPLPGPPSVSSLQGGEPPKEHSIPELISLTARTYALDPALVRAVIEQESGGQADAVRFEGHLYEKLRNKERNDSRRMQLASSHGLMQVLGIEAQRRGVSFGALYDPETNIEVGTAILASCIEKSGATSKLERLKQGLSCYNTGRHSSERGKLYAEQVLLRFLAAKIG